MKNRIEIEKAEGNTILEPCINVYMIKLFEKITTIVIGVTTIVVDQITTIVVGIAIIVVFCDNRGWWLIVTIVITSSSSNIQNISIKLIQLKFIPLSYLLFILDT